MAPMKNGIKKYTCEMCGRQLRAEQMIFSTFTRNRYCAIDQPRCEEKSRQRRRAA